MDFTGLLLIVAIIVLYSFQTLFCTLYTRNYPGREDLASPVFCVTEAVFIVLLTWALHGFRFRPSGPTALYGLLNGLVLLGFNLSLMGAGKRGSYAFFNMALLYGAILVPMAYSVIFLQEHTTALQWGGVGLMLIAFLLMNWEGKSGQKPKKGYYLCCAVLFVCNGLYSVFLKMQAMACAQESTEMVMITFGLMGLSAFIQLAAREKKHTLRAFRQNKKSLKPLAACLLSAGLAVNGLVLVLPRVNTVVFYTAENGGVLLLACLYSIFLFREKPTPRKLAGIAIAVASLTMLRV